MIVSLRYSECHQWFWWKFWSRWLSSWCQAISQVCAAKGLCSNWVGRLPPFWWSWPEFCASLELPARIWPSHHRRWAIGFASRGWFRWGRPSPGRGFWPGWNRPGLVGLGGLFGVVAAAFSWALRSHGFWAGVWTSAKGLWRGSARAVFALLSWGRRTFVWPNCWFCHTVAP